MKQSVLALILACAAAIAWAHDPGLSSATMRLFPDKLEAILTFALKDADELAGLDTNNDGQVSAEEYAAAQERLGNTVAEAFEVRFDDTLAKATDVRCQLDQNNNVDVYLSIPGKKFSKLAVRSKMIAGFRLDHRQYFMLQNPSGVTLAERLLSANSDTVEIQVDAEPASPSASATASPPAEPPKNNSRSFTQFLALGIRHILTGYDHLLFLFGLLIVTRSFKSSLAVITCFTIAHSITLAVATFNLVQIPSKIVEPLIAVTIIYVGVENILRHGDPHGRWMLTFAFGLIHGFGFASVLREMGVASRAGGVAMPLFSFNLGVEVGQIAVAAVVLPFVWKLRAKPIFVKRWVPMCSAIVALAGAYWFVQRVWLR